MDSWYDFWFQLFVWGLVIGAIGLFIYRYFLVTKSIGKGQYWTSAALASPEIGLLISLI